MAKRELQEVNAGSMADIAFLLLIFFLMTTTMDTDTGIARMLPQPVPKDQPPPPPIKERNVFAVIVNSNNELFVEGEVMDIKDLREAAKEFIQNPNNLETLPEMVDVEVPYFGVVKLSKKSVISLKNDRDTKYQVYLKVQNELQAAYTELREELAQKRFRKSFDDLEEDQQEAIKEIYGQRISEAEPVSYGKR